MRAFVLWPCTSTCRPMILGDLRSSRRERLSVRLLGSATDGVELSLYRTMFGMTPAQVEASCLQFNRDGSTNSIPSHPPPSIGATVPTAWCVYPCRIHGRWLPRIRIQCSLPHLPLGSPDGSPCALMPSLLGFMSPAAYHSRSVSPSFERLLSSSQRIPK